MRKIFIFMLIVLMVLPFLAISGEAYTLSFEGKALIAGYKEVGNPSSWKFIKDCNVSLNFTKWTMLKITPFCWFSLKNGELLIYNSESNYNYVDGTRVRGFLIVPDGIWTVWGI